MWWSYTHEGPSSVSMLPYIDPIQCMRAFAFVCGGVGQRLIRLEHEIPYVHHSFLVLFSKAFSPGFFRFVRVSFRLKFCFG